MTIEPIGERHGPNLPSSLANGSKVNSETGLAHKIPDSPFKCRSAVPAFLNQHIQHLAFVIDSAP